MALLADCGASSDRLGSNMYWPESNSSAGRKLLHNSFRLRINSQDVGALALSISLAVGLDQFDGRYAESL
jgi:hypothetical protein